MANLAQFDLKSRGGEARIRALLEDLVQGHAGVRPQFRMALAVWFRRSPEANDQHLLELMSGPPIDEFAKDRISLLWNTGQEGPPYANVQTTSVDHFLRLRRTHLDRLDQYRDRYEVLFFDKRLLPVEITEFFNIITEPPGLIKGWYVAQDEYDRAKGIQDLLSRRGSANPELGLIKIEESPDFTHCRGLLHIEIMQKWLPLSPEGIRPYSYYTDYQGGRRAYLLFEGGSLYEVLKFEVKTAPEHASKLLGTVPDDRYPEVYLRAVRPPARPAA